MKKTVTGVLEIGPDTLKLARVEKGRAGQEIRAARVVPLAGADDAAGRARSAFRDLRLSGHRLIGAVSRQIVNVRLLELPSTDRSEISDMVDLQIGKHTPYSKDEIVSGYKVICGSREGYSRVMVAIVQLPILRQRYHFLDEAGIDPDSMTVSTEGLLALCARAVKAGEPGTLTAVLDVDTVHSELLVLSGSDPVFNRVIMAGAGAPGAEDFRARVALEMQRSIEASQGEVPGRALSRVLLTGAGAHDKELAKVIGERLGVRCEGLDLLDGRGGPAVKDAASNASFSAVAGLAEIEGGPAFELAPDTVRAKRSLAAKARALAAMAVLAAWALASFSVYCVVSWMLAGSRAAAVSEEMAALEPDVRRLERMREIVSLVMARQGDAGMPVALLAVIQGAIPDEVRVSSLDMNLPGESVQIQANAANTRQIREFEEALRASNLFSAVRENRTSMDQGSRRWVFDLSCDLEVPR